MFDRQFQFYFWKFFLPVITIVLISWVPFKLHILPVVRISIALSTVIFIGWHFLLQPNPLQVSYSTRLELWRGVNFVFVVLAALETILVMHMSKAHATKVPYFIIWCLPFFLGHYNLCVHHGLKYKMA